MTIQPPTQPTPVAVHPLTVDVAQRVSSLSHFYRSTLDAAITIAAQAARTTITPEDRATVRGQVALVLARSGWRLGAAELAEAGAAALALGQAGVERCVR